MADAQDTNNIAVLSSLLGRMEKTIEQSFAEVNRRLGDHSHRLTIVEEKLIRADEREKTEDRFRQVLKDDRDERDQEAQTRVTLSFARWQLWCAVILAVMATAGAVVGVLQIL